MATEEQILRFIIDMQTRSFKKGLDSITDGLDKVVESAKESAKETKSEGNEGLPGKILPKKGVKRTQRELKLLKGGVDQLKKGLHVLGDTAKVWAKEWEGFYTNMETFRKQTGMTRVEIKEFRVDVLRASADFGVAMDKTAQVARSIARGSTKARNEIAKLAAAQVFMGEATGQSTETVADQARFLTRVLELEDDLAKKIPLASARMARFARVDAESITKARLAHGNLVIRLMREGGLAEEESIKRVDALSASLFRGGADAEGVNTILSKMGERTSILFKAAAGAGFDFEESLKAVDRIYKSFLQRAPGSQEKLLQIIGTAREETVIATARATKFYKENLVSFEQAMKMTQKALEDDLKVKMSINQRASMSYERLKNDVVGDIESIVGTQEEWSRTTAEFVDRISDSLRKVSGVLSGRRDPEGAAGFKGLIKGGAGGTPLKRGSGVFRRQGLFDMYNPFGAKPTPGAFPSAPLPPKAKAPVPDALRTDAIRDTKESRRLQNEQLTATLDTNKKLQGWMDLQQDMERRNPGGGDAPGRRVQVPDLAAVKSGRR